MGRPAKLIQLSRPVRAEIQRAIDAAIQDPFSYPEVAATRPELAPTLDRDIRRPIEFSWSADRLSESYFVNQNRVCLGQGRERFESARQDLARWKMFAVGWARICWPETPVGIGAIVGVLTGGSGVWSLNLSRVVY